MSEEHSGLSHDLPEYVPNWPVPVRKIRAVVYMRAGVWFWGHQCPNKGTDRVFRLGGAKATQAKAFAAAHKHVQGCW
jgi:hypothetical protein